MSQHKSLLLTLFAFAAIFLMQRSVVDAVCNACNPNGIACISETDFQMCFNGERDVSRSYECPPDTVCVNLASRCAPRSAIEPECSAGANCGVCNGIKMFTCTSRNTFVQCNGTEPMPATQSRCPNGLTCYSSQAEICVSDCKLGESLECTNLEPL